MICWVETKALRNNKIGFIQVEQLPCEPDEARMIYEEKAEGQFQKVFAKEKEIKPVDSLIIVSLQVKVGESEQDIEIAGRAIIDCTFVCRPKIFWNWSAFDRGQTYEKKLAYGQFKKD